MARFFGLEIVIIFKAAKNEEKGKETKSWWKLLIRSAPKNCRRTFQRRLDARKTVGRDSPSLSDEDDDDEAVAQQLLLLSRRSLVFLSLIMFQGESLFRIEFVERIWRSAAPGRKRTFVKLERNRRRQEKLFREAGRWWQRRISDS